MSKLIVLLVLASIACRMFAGRWPWELFKSATAASDEALGELSKRVGFRVANGLSERVVYRELFPSGLTLLDKGQLGELGTSHLVARQELRQLVAGLNLPVPVKREPELALATGSAA